MIQKTPSQSYDLSVNGRLAEHYERLAHRLSHTQVSSRGAVQAMGVTSYLPGEGVSTIVSNLATACINCYEKPVLVVDANFSSPSLHEIFQLSAEPGLADAIVSSLDPTSLLHKLGRGRLAVLTAGSSGARGHIVPDPDKPAQLVASLRQHFGLIIVDLAALAHTSVPRSLMKSLDGVLLVVEAGRRTLRESQRVKRLLVESGVDPLGVVLNKQREKVPAWLTRSF